MNRANARLISVPYRWRRKRQPAAQISLVKLQVVIRGASMFRRFRPNLRIARGVAMMDGLELTPHRAIRWPTDWMTKRGGERLIAAQVFPARSMWQFAHEKLSWP